MSAFGKTMAWVLGGGAVLVLAAKAMRDSGPKKQPATPAPLPLAAVPRPNMPSATAPNQFQAYAQDISAAVDVGKKLSDFASSLPFWGNDDGDSSYVPDAPYDLGYSPGLGYT